MKDLHGVGTFCGIVEMQDMGDRLRMIVMAHRRIRLIGQMVVDDKDLDAEVEAAEAAAAAQQNGDDKNGNGRRRRRRRVSFQFGKDKPNTESVLDESETSAEGGGAPVVSSTTTTVTSPLEGVDEAEPELEPIPVLMIETENVKPLKFHVDTEVKV